MKQFRAKTGLNRPAYSTIQTAWPLFVLAVTVLITTLSPAAVDMGSGLPVQVPSSLDPLLWKYPPALQAALDAFGRGMEHFAGGRYAAALAAMPDGPSAASTAVEDYILFYRASSCLETNKEKDALNSFRALQQRHADSPVLQEAILGEARALLQLHDASAALTVLNGGKVTQDAEASLLRAQALEEIGKRAEAIQVYLHVYSDFVQSAQAAAAERRLRSISPAFLTKADNRDALLNRSENLIRAGRNQEARTLLLKLAATRTTGLKAERLSLLLGDADTNLSRLPEAMRYLRRVSDPSLAAQANYLVGVCQRGQRNEAAFLEARDRALRHYPQSEYTEKLLYSVATFYELDNQQGPAQEAYQAIVRGFPKGEYFERALWKLALFSYFERRYDEALKGFWQCLLANPSPAAASAPIYWMGRCCERFGDARKAAYFLDRTQALANNSYYGQRAREALASLKPDGSPTTPDLSGLDFEQVRRRLDAIQQDPVPSPLSQPSGPAVMNIERARQLAAAGLFDLASSELSRGCAQNGNDKAVCFALSRIYASRENYFGSISTMRRAYPNYVDLQSAALPEQFWDLLYPVCHYNIVTQQASRNDLDSDLILALIRQESSFQASARSKANARGLMQVLPSTGRTLARQAGITKYSVGRLYTPETNIALGTRYLASLLQRYGGKVELALAAYNAGNSRVDRWLQQFGDVDMAEFVERIPFSETRSYVKQVLTNKAHYHLRTAESAVSAFHRGNE